MYATGVSLNVDGRRVVAVEFVEGRFAQSTRAVHAPFARGLATRHEPCDARDMRTGRGESGRMTRSNGMCAVVRSLARSALRAR